MNLVEILEWQETVIEKQAETIKKLSEIVQQNDLLDDEFFSSENKLENSKAGEEHE